MGVLLGAVDNSVDKWQKVWWMVHFERWISFSIGVAIGKMGENGDVGDIGVAWDLGEIWENFGFFWWCVDLPARANPGIQVDPAAENTPVKNEQNAYLRHFLDSQNIRLCKYAMLEYSCPKGQAPTRASPKDMNLENIVVFIGSVDCVHYVDCVDFVAEKARIIGL